MIELLAYQYNSNYLISNSFCIHQERKPKRSFHLHDSGLINQQIKDKNIRFLW